MKTKKNAARRYGLRFREGGKWLRSIELFKSIVEAKEHAAIIGARKIKIRILPNIQTQTGGATPPPKGT